MAKPNTIPFNVDILRTNTSAFNILKPVTSLDYFESLNGDLHDEGLFSLTIFGRVGDEVRDQRFSYVDTKVSVFHPFIYRALCQLRGFYKDLMAGKQYAIWDEKQKDFIAANELTGRTGYSFFLEHWAEIEFASNKSPVREDRIKRVNKFRDVALTNRIVVMPAGLRDIEVGDDGRTTVAEINALYRKVVSISRTIPITDFINDPTYDLARHMLQMAFNEIYDAIEKMLTGKSGFFQAKWASRRVFNGTRNVITAMNVPIAELGAPNVPKFTDTVVGLYQLIKGILPMTIYQLRTGYLADIFASGNGMAQLVNPVTLKSELVELPIDVYDRWTTMEGLEKVITSYKDTELRHRTVMLDKYALALIYAPPDRKVFRVFSDIEDLPAELDRAHVRPINLVELIYLSGYRVWNSYCGTVTRYPVSGTGSVYPTTLYTKTTIRGEARKELGPDWQPIEEDVLALEYPTYDPLAYLDSLVIPSARLAGLGADFDGDTASLNILYSDEAVTEIRELLNSKKSYVDPRGGLMASANVDTVALVFRNFTRDPENP